MEVSEVIAKITTVSEPMVITSPTLKVEVNFVLVPVMVAPWAVLVTVPGPVTVAD